MNENEAKEYGEQLKKWRLDPILWIKDRYHLIPQPVKPERKEDWIKLVNAKGDEYQYLLEKVDATWFGDFRGYDSDGVQIWTWFDFKKGKHLTWQQTLFFLTLRKARRKEIPNSISIVSGHGIGKSAMVALAMLWFIECHYASQIACTAPTAYQMFDVLWKEADRWIRKLPSEIRDLFDWQNTYVRMKPAPQEWFARAKTASKENTEALAGVHADYVMLAVDEASAVRNEVYDTAEGALTSGTVIMILISNGTRAEGYFFDSHHKNKSMFARLRFSSEQSPIVDKQYVARQLKRHGRGSVQFDIRVSGGFPPHKGMDERGYMPIIEESQIIELPELNHSFVGRTVLGVDPAGAGKDKASFWARDIFSARCVYQEDVSDENTIAQAIIRLVKELNINGLTDVYMDGFDERAGRISQRVMLASDNKIVPILVNVGDKPPKGYEDRYLNVRAYNYDRLANDLVTSSLKIVQNSNFKREMKDIKYKNNLRGVMQIMPKEIMAKEGIASPNDADALMITYSSDLSSMQVQQYSRTFSTTSFGDRF